YGFKPKAHLPCYGLAEGTLIITGKHHAQEPKIVEFDAACLEAGRAVVLEDSERSMPLVSSGVTDDLHEVKIVDSATRTELPDGQIGEVWINGPSVAAGYWRREEESADLFGASLAESDGKGWLRSGDLGVIVEGELFIVGRSKDLLIVRGRNIHPHDVEEAAEAAHTLLRPHCSAAFPVSLDDPSHVSMALEIDPPSEDDDLDEIIAAIRVQVSRELELKLQGVALVPVGAVPKTTSGKVQRRLCRQQLLDGEIEPIAAWHANV
ncbi:MAG: AMP-binding protein, partial [Solirubrobacteraceae bacterium]|nr:AMP-binding protein [Solirubrobacteraceae bacterium]